MPIGGGRYGTVATALNKKLGADAVILIVAKDGMIDTSAHIIDPGLLTALPGYLSRLSSDLAHDVRTTIDMG